MRTLLALALATALAPLCPAPLAAPAPSAKAPAVTASAAEDPFLWLEPADDPKALDWVRGENARSLAVLEGDPRYAALHAEALKIVNAKDRTPYAAFLKGETLINFWQDETHVRGVLRQTTLSSYRTATPAWETLLDVDALAKAENANWVYQGAACIRPRMTRCLVRLSDGGKDSAEVREFDLTTRRFVENGFRLPESKQTVEAVDEDTLILSRDWGVEGGAPTLTESGYPFVIKMLRRGQPLSAAREVFRGEPKDVSADPFVLRDMASGRETTMARRAVSFFETRYYVLADDGPRPLPLPLPLKADIEGLTGGRLLATLREAWTPAPGGPTYPQGALISMDFAALQARAAAGAFAPGLLDSIRVVFAPGPRQSIEQVVLTRGRVAAAIYDNVRGRIVTFAPQADGGWSQGGIDLPPDSAVGIVSASEDDDRVMATATGFLDPAGLWLADAAGAAAPERLKTAPARFDASGLAVKQFEAVSTDGSRIPYFVVGPKAMKLDGSNPTLLYAYGGFQVSMLPTYSGALGKLWLERGGVYVLANIRGGGEFGPAWHEAGLKTRRQVVFDDFAAVGRDLIARKIASPRRLGVEGGSNGGLLMGVELTQHPELWNAVVIQVPLLDMLRFDKIGAGASWVGEYGSPDDPHERAFLASISPYHNLKAGTAYPEPFFVTSTKDDRVQPAHARKMAARMQAMGLPFFYYENIDGGHAASANLNEAAHRTSLEFTYLTRKLMD